MSESRIKVTAFEGGTLSEPPGDDERFWEYPPMKRVEVRETIPPGMGFITIDIDDISGQVKETYGKSDEPAEHVSSGYAPAGLPEAPWRPGARATLYETVSQHDGTLMLTLGSMAILGRVASKWLAEHPGWGVCRSGVIHEPLEVKPGGNPWHQLRETAFVVLTPVVAGED